MLQNYETLKSIQKELFQKHKTTIQELNFYLELFNLIDTDITEEDKNYIIKTCQKWSVHDCDPEQIKEELIEDGIIQEEKI